MKNRKIIITVLAILGIVFITAGVSYAFFSYSGTGIGKNSITSGSITFHYEEGNRSISLTDAMPMTFDQAKNSNNYFDFTITSNTVSNVDIPYYITVKRITADDSIDRYVYVDLRQVANKGTNEEHEYYVISEDSYVYTTPFSNLGHYRNPTLGITSENNERVVYKGIVPANSSNYSKDYRLRMFISWDDIYNRETFKYETHELNYEQTITGSCSDTTYTTREACVAANKDWTDVATANNKTFKAIVNVYAEGESIEATPLVDKILVDNYTTKDVIIPGEKLKYDNNTTNLGEYKNGLFKAVDTNGGYTYYYRGNVNNILKIGNDLWKIIRINEDGSVRLLRYQQLTVDNYHQPYNVPEAMYFYAGQYGNVAYSIVSSWYNSSIKNDDNYKNIVTTGTYCQAEKVRGRDGVTNVQVPLLKDYVPSYSCPDSGGSINNKLTLDVGLITVDEALMSGAPGPSYISTSQTKYWTMSPAGYSESEGGIAWVVATSADLYNYAVSMGYAIKPVINIKGDTLVTVEHDNSLNRNIYVVAY